MSSLYASLKSIGSIVTEKKWKHQYFRHCYRAAYSLVSSQICRKVNLIQALMHVLITCKYQKDQMKQWRHHFPHYKSMGVFLRHSRADNSRVSGPIWPKFELFLDIMHVLVPYKFKMDLTNSDREKSGDINILDTQGQLNNYMEGSGSATIKPEDQWSCKRSPDILA